MIRLFYTIVPAARDCGSPVSRAESVRQMHDSAWSLLALSLHRLDPQRFPGGGAGQLPEVRKGPYGKPAFADPSLPAFSLSHSGRVALCAVSDRRRSPLTAGVCSIRFSAVRNPMSK